MNRLFATLTVLAMLLLAIAISFLQTIKIRGQLGSAATVLLGLEGALAIALTTVGAILLWRRGVSAGNKSSRVGFGFVQPLRRLLASVWS